MKKVYELNVVKCRATHVNESEVKDCNYKCSFMYLPEIEKFLDDMLYVGKRVYFEDPETAECYVDEHLDEFKNMNFIKKDTPTTVYDKEFKVLDIQKDSEKYEDEVDNSSGTLHTVRLIILDTTKNDFELFNPIIVVSYEWEVKEHDVIED